MNNTANQVHPFLAAVYSSANGFLQQVNAPCRKDRIVQEWFHEHNSEFSFLRWPAQSPDLNPIARLWNKMEQDIRSRDPLPANLTQLWEDWSQHGHFRHLLESMLQRIEAVLRAKGEVFLIFFQLSIDEIRYFG